MLGVIFVPWQKSVSNSGALPGTSGATYEYDHDEGRLRVRDASGALLAIGRRDRAGIFYDVTTGVLFAREIKGAVVFDGDAVRPRDEAEADAGTLPRADTDENEPKLCPEPGPDQPGSEYASIRAKAYQEQISRMVNPLAPLQYGLAVSLLNPLTGKIVHYDECDRRTGTMIEAKGPGFIGLLGFDQGRKNVREQWLDQSLRETQASGQRDVVWYFAEHGAADYARDLFADSRRGRERIIIRVVPAVMR